MGKKFDFSGWATRNDLLCADGRTIRRDAFKDCDGQTVPLIWNHDHKNPEAVLGHALLENREDGVYAYVELNNTKAGKHAKAIVEHGDVRSLSIYANKLKHRGSDVVHGIIRELSLVIAGANPGAYVDFVMAHDAEGEDAVYANYDESALVIYHSDEEEVGEKGEPEEMDGNTNFTKEQEELIHSMIDEAVAKASSKKTEDSDNLQHAEEKPAEKAAKEKTIQDVIDGMDEDEKEVLYTLVGIASSGEGAEDEDDDEDDDNEGGNNEMKHNVFDSETKQADTLMHFDMDEIVKIAKRSNGSFREALANYMESNELQHGIEEIETLFPDAKALNNIPDFIKRDDNWVADVMKGVHHTPFSRIKSVFADITEADARAKGYIKGNMKKEEFFTLLKRTTTPTTVYKKQKLDRDDVVDITDFDVIAWLKMEMRMMLEEEIARAILVGDGRAASSEDKINEQNIRPIWTDDDMYTVKQKITVAAGATAEDKARQFIKETIRSRKHYKGSGNPIMFMSEDMLTDCLLIEDKNGRIIYDSVEKLATALRVRRIVTSPILENLTREVGANTHTLAGLYVNLADYNVGADKGGAVSMFDDFDIDYNAQKYLIETRISGALTKPYSAVALEFVAATAA